MIMSRTTLLMGGILAIVGAACAASPATQSSPPPPPPPPADAVQQDADEEAGPPIEVIGTAKETTALPNDQVLPGKDKKLTTETKPVEEARGPDALDRVAAPPPPTNPIAAAPRPTDPLASGGGSANARGGSPGGSDGAAQGESIEGGVYGGVVGEKKGGQKIGATSEVRGSIDREEIRRVVIAHVNEVQRCYEQGLKRQPGLEGRVVLKFLIGKTGTVTAVTVAQTTMNDRQVEQCMVGAATKWTFPKPKGEGDVTFVYPFVLKSAP